MAAALFLMPDEVNRCVDFSAKDVAAAWTDEPDLCSAISNHFSKYVPCVSNALSTSSTAPTAASIGKSKNEEFLYQHLLLEPLGWFLCAEDPETVLSHLSQSSQPPQLCGHVFHMGEPTYSCRECAVDPTCVLCMDCFQQSIHKTHRYRMNTSSGGGFCDCGDVEAWKHGPYCQQHRPHSDPGLPLDPVSLLPSDLACRARELFSICLCYASDLLTWEGVDSLPAKLRILSCSGTYCCMLFNDEVHTYDQVIYTLQKAVNCTQKEAVTFATNVDRDGRKTVRVGDSKQCEQAKNIIERHTSRGNHKPLKVCVMHSAVVAHQAFAMRLLAWLGQVISNSEGLRRILCQEGLRPGHDSENASPLGRLMLCDSHLWKGARNVYHQLLMSSVLMDMEYKRNFGMLFAKNYVRLQKDFMEDDHERSVSVTALSVQLFTVPTLAQELMTTQNLLKTILLLFYDQLKDQRDRNGHFQFERYSDSQDFHFRRMQNILSDLKFLLKCRPMEWNDLRQCFLDGFESLLELLKAIQGMEPITRQVSHHLEVEPEWETAVSLQMQLSPILTMVQDWCASDELVLVEAYRRSLAALSSCQDEGPMEQLILCGHSMEAGQYIVSQRPVSIHLPLSRLIAGLHVLLSKTGVAYQSPTLIPLGDMSPPSLIEQPLRCLALVAQERAGMWRRNGFSLVNQVYYYQNVRCRREMFDKDIMMLQVGASMMDPNHFIMLLLKRFEVFPMFGSLDYPRNIGSDIAKDAVQHNATLLEELLHLIIMVVGERYVPGLGQVTGEDVVRREVIHQLSIKPMAHSELVKALPEDENHETGLEAVVESVATFRKPGVTGKGVYVLKSECMKNFNILFYHYARTEQSKAEESQRKGKKQNGEVVVFPPPEMPPLLPMFASLENVLQADVLNCVLGTILHWVQDPRCQAWTEAMLQKVLHLVMMALQVEKQQLEVAGETESNFTFSLKALRPVSGWQSAAGSRGTSSPSMFTLLERLQNVTQLDAHKDCITWTLQLFETIQQLRRKSGHFPSMVEQQPKESPRERDKTECKRKAEMARLRREKIMAQMSAMQRHFIAENRELFKQTVGEMESSAEEGSSSGLAPVEVSSGSGEDACPVAIGPCRSGPGALGTGVTERGNGRRVMCCILCQEEQETSPTATAMVLAAFVQRSTVMAGTRARAALDPGAFDQLLMPADVPCGTHTTSCGHVMHAHCWQSFFEAVQAKEQRRQHRLRAHTSYDIDNGEFLCPLCQCISNTVIPILFCSHGDVGSWQLSFCSEEAQMFRQKLPLESWLEKLPMATWLENLTCRVSGLHVMLQRATEPGGLSIVEVPQGFRNIHNFGIMTPLRYSESMQAMLATFGTAAFHVGLKTHPNEQDPRVPVMVWNTCSFTIQAVESLLHEEQKPLLGSLTRRQESCLQALMGFAPAHQNTVPLHVQQAHFIRLFAFLTQDRKIEAIPSILQVDLFHVLVSSVICCPAVYSEKCRSLRPTPLSSSIDDLYLLHLVTMAHIIQILLTCETDESMELDSTSDACPEHEEQESIFRLHQHCMQLANRPNTTSCPWQLRQMLRAAVLPFLRCAALFFHFLLGAPLPSGLQGTGPEQFDLLCHYLSLPTNLTMLFDTYRETVDPLLHRWCNAEAVRSFQQGQMVVIRYPRKMNKMVHLPQDYSSLINKASRFRCPHSDGEDNRTPTLCLVCGTILCSQCYSCQAELDGEDVGACIAHSAICGAGIGIFLRVRECQTLLLCGKNKGCFYPPPYLDEYGETDQLLRRGNPLLLCLERYHKLQRLWHLHAIPEEIAHAQEANQSFTTNDWQHL
uniref:E3 ubiquitin-protein ligase UBR2 n=1 Tax=Myxine glutinosa TaxID=7769 RepID=UPI00358E1268